MHGNIHPHDAELRFYVPERNFFAAFDESETHGNGHAAQIERSGKGNVFAVLCNFCGGKLFHQRVGVYRNAPLRPAAEQSEHVAHVQISRKIFIGKIYFVIFIGKHQRTQPAFERIEFQPAHIQKHLRGKRFARNGHVRIQRYLVGEKGGEPVSEVIPRGQLFVRGARRVGVGIVNKIFVIVGNVCRSLVIRIGNDGVAHAVRIHALARSIIFVYGKRINGPVRAEGEGHFYGRKDGIIVEIAHRDHGMFIIVSGIFVVERGCKGIQPVIRLF